MSGISEALVATAIGLLVAIPAVIAFNIFQGRVRKAMARSTPSRTWRSRRSLLAIRTRRTCQRAERAATGELTANMPRANNFGSGDDEPGDMININVTPLVDITLASLIIFMVTASYIVSLVIRVDLPKAGSGTEQQRHPPWG